MRELEESCPNAAMRVAAASVLFEKAVGEVKSGRIPRSRLVWLELTGCSGNIISLLDGARPGFGELAAELSDILFENSLMSAEGEKAMDELFGAEKGSFILAVEGAVSTKDGGMYTVIGRRKGMPVTALSAVRELGEKAAYVIAVGTCASAGGISAASPNPAECRDVGSVLQRRVIRLPGCPCNPDWFLGTLAYIMLFGEPELDDRGRPLLFYSTLIHDCCPRRPYFDRGIFASELGEETCMFKLGCRGPVTRTDCPLRKWNERVNWPIGADSPCIGCAMFGFPDLMEPFVSFSGTGEREDV